MKPKKTKKTNLPRLLKPLLGSHEAPRFQENPMTLSHSNKIGTKPLTDTQLTKTAIEMDEISQKQSENSELTIPEVMTFGYLSRIGKKLKKIIKKNK